MSAATAGSARSGATPRTRFQELAEHVRDEFRVRSAILDGESCRWTTRAGRSSAGIWLAAAISIAAAFDLLWVNGRDFRSLPPSRRKQRLEVLIGTATPVLSRIFSVEECGCDLLGVPFSSSTSKGSWPSESPTPTPRQRLGPRSRTRRTLNPTGGESCSVGRAKTYLQPHLELLYAWHQAGAAKPGILASSSMPHGIRARRHEGHDRRAPKAGPALSHRA